MKTGLLFSIAHEINIFSKRRLKAQVKRNCTRYKFDFSEINMLLKNKTKKENQKNK